MAQYHYAYGTGLTSAETVWVLRCLGVSVYGVLGVLAPELASADRVPASCCVLAAFSSPLRMFRV